MKLVVFVVGAFSLSAFSLMTSAAHASDETEALKQEIQMLERRIEQLEKQEKTQAAQLQSAPAVPASASPPVNPSPSAVAVVTQNDSPAPVSPLVKLDSQGLTVTSADQQSSLNLHGFFQVDDRTFFDPADASTTDTFLIRSARAIADGKFTPYVDTRLQIDFGKGTTTLLDAYGNIHPLPGNNMANLRVGEFKIPVGVERWLPESDLPFVERGQTTNLVPYRDIGAMIYGQPVSDQVEYYLGVTNGAPDLVANTTVGDSSKDFVGRVMVRPLVWTGLPDLEGLNVGVGGTYGIHQGTAATPDLTTGYVTTGQRVFFIYKSGVFANGPQWRLNPQLTYYNGPFSVLSEYVLNDQAVSNGTHSTMIRNEAWEGIASYVLTGERANFNGVTPAHSFSPRAREWGAFEILARVSELSAAKSAFLGPGYADPTVSSSNAFETVIGATWYFSHAVKFNLDFARTTFDGGTAGGFDHPDEKVLMSRLQFRL
jgi:phosphate-selective porin OprO and OprP